MTVYHALLGPGHVVIGCCTCSLLIGVTDDVVRRVNDYSAQHVAVTMWAFAKLDTTPRPELMQVCHMQ